MRRTNELVAEPAEQWHKECLYEWFVANCAYWNELTDRRRQAYFDPDGDVWAVDTDDLYEQYGPVAGTATAQQLKRKNDEAWESLFESLAEYDETAPGSRPAPPGYWGSREAGYELRGILRQDGYVIEGKDGTASQLSISIGTELKDKYGLGEYDRLPLILQGNPRWRGEDCRLELTVDEAADCIRVHHTVDVQPGERDRRRRLDFAHTPDQGSAERTAAIDLGANNTMAVLTETGEALVFRARDLFERFRATGQHRSDLQARLPAEREWSRRLTLCCRTQYGRRDHHRDAAAKHVAEWLLAQAVGTVYVGDLTDVLSTHWRARVNERTHNFWSHRQLVDRLQDTFEVAGIELREVDEAGTSSACPGCGGEVHRAGDLLQCHSCGLETHADLAGAGNLLAAQTDTDVSGLFRPMARPAAHDPGRAWDGDLTVTYLQWNDHEWTPTRTVCAGTLASLSLDQRGPRKSKIFGMPKNL